MRKKGQPKDESFRKSGLKGVETESGMAAGENRTPREHRVLRFGGQKMALTRQGGRKKKTRDTIKR